MRLLLWTVLVCACAVQGDDVLVLLSGALLIGCAADCSFTRRGRVRVDTRWIG
ncbi:hypothetical protein FHS29_006763 [Saccharothrix tamanrassetensis]|uniref:Uncharacterized protein n=1 Tax=Saccharothrix tamanrassetensis TaxID=1051531 RepID=A0A841CSA4_9PSEU|nr:hypothetical protein [Saccharothrix tamanrassetensis]MBB5960140.1 hypothetical protein [Saccharothrix tamanrassetensis]